MRSITQLARLSFLMRKFSSSDLRLLPKNFLEISILKLSNSKISHWLCNYSQYASVSSLEINEDGEMNGNWKHFLSDTYFLFTDETNEKIFCSDLKIIE